MNEPKVKVWIECVSSAVWKLEDDSPTIQFWWRIKTINGKIITPHEMSPTKAGSRASARHWGKVLGLEVRLRD